MKAYLMKFGIPEEDILMDDQSFSTDENIRNARALLPGTDRVLIVTSGLSSLPRPPRSRGMQDSMCLWTGKPYARWFLLAQESTHETLRLVVNTSPFVHKLGIPIG